MSPGAEGNSIAANRSAFLIAGAERELRLMAGQMLRRERSNHTLQPTALVGELWIKLLGRRDLSFESEAAFRAWAAKTMRHILVDHARRKHAQKRGGGRAGLSLDGIAGVEGADVLELNDALNRLSFVFPRAAQVVELRFFGGMDYRTIAQRLGTSERTARADWTLARGWLFRQMENDTSRP